MRRKSLNLSNFYVEVSYLSDVLLPSRYAQEHI